MALTKPQSCYNDPPIMSVIMKFPDVTDEIDVCIASPASFIVSAKSLSRTNGGIGTQKVALYP